MGSDAYLSLISGSDLRGVALEGYGKPVALGRKEAAAAACAFGHWLRERTGEEAPRVCVGHDPRLSADFIMQGALCGLARAGCEAVPVGLCTTPAMFLSTLQGPKAHGAIMLTASHMPSEYNGLKFFTRDGGLNGKEIRELAARMEPPLCGDDTPRNPTRAFLTEYTAILCDFIAQGRKNPLSGMRIVVDAGNGSGGFFADLLRKLGADVIGQFLEPDGSFPNHIPNPEDRGAMRALCDRVVAEKADLGIIFDADCDRSALADGQGTPLNRDRLIALVAAYLLPEHPGATIVTDSVTTLGLTAFIEALGGRHCRFKRGYRNVIDEAVRLTAQGTPAPLAIETSGHCALQENHYLDDGAYLAAWLLRHIGADLAAGRRWTERIATLATPAVDIELRLPLLRSDFRTDGEAVLRSMERLPQGEPRMRLAADSAEGVRLLYGEDAFLMARVSVHDPVMPINVQASTQKDAELLLRALFLLLLPMADMVNPDPLTQYITP